MSSHANRFTYQDFRLLLRPHSRGGYRSQVIDSPAGESAEERFELPFAPEDLGRFAQAFEVLAEEGRRRGEAARGWPRHLSLGEGEGATRRSETVPFTPRHLGDRLFRSLFHGSVRERYFQSLGGLRRQRLRIKLQIDPRTPELVALRSLPWEFLFQSDRQSHLAVETRFSVARYPALPFPGELPPMPENLRILLVVAEPCGAPRLGLREEAAEIEQAWGPRKGVEVERLTGATLKGLTDRLEAREFHVLHFMGHGTLDEARSTGVLLFEDRDGAADPVSGRKLRVQLAPFETLRLIVLNACHTASTANSGAASGVATALLLGGFPAVVAHQFPITDRAARVFSEAFYHRLAAEGQVDRAVTAGRLAIHGECSESVEWGVPALFLRAPDGQLFEMALRVRIGPGGRSEVESRRADGVKRKKKWAVAVLVLVLAASGFALSGRFTGGAFGWLGGGSPGVTPPDGEPELQEGRAQPEGPRRAEGEASSDGSLEPGGHPHSPSVSPTPELVELREGVARYLPGAEATVSVSFGSYRGESLTKLTIRPRGGESFTKAVQIGQEVEFEVPGTGEPETRSFAVLAVDRRARTVTLEDG